MFVSFRLALCVSVHRFRTSSVLTVSHSISETEMRNSNYPDGGAYKDRTRSYEEVSQLFTYPDRPLLIKQNKSMKDGKAYG